MLCFNVLTAKLWKLPIDFQPSLPDPVLHRLCDRPLRTPSQLSQSEWHLRRFATLIPASVIARPCASVWAPRHLEKDSGLPFGARLVLASVLALHEDTSGGKAPLVNWLVPASAVTRWQTVDDPAHQAAHPAAAGPPAPEHARWCLPQ